MYQNEKTLKPAQSVSDRAYESSDGMTTDFVETIMSYILFGFSAKKVIMLFRGW